MPIYFQRGDASSSLTEADFREALAAAFKAGGDPQRVLALPPDHTRSDSRAGELTCLAHEMLGNRLTDVMPALGTHEAMTEAELSYMFGDLPRDLIRIHDWKNAVVTLGEVSGEYVRDVTEEIYSSPWKAQVNELVANGGHDMVLSLGQVVPHEVIGMANYNKNVFVGTGGSDGINESHYLSALYGMERIMGRCDTPLRRILNRAQEDFCQDMPLMFVLTVVQSLQDGSKAVRGIFVGDHHDVFEAAGKLAAEVNCIVVDRPPKTVVVTMNPDKYKKTWLANKAIYRTRMLIGDEGTLVVLAPGVKGFGESETVDRLIRKYGYRTTPEVLNFVEQNQELRENLGAAAHLIHGTPNGRFKVLYAPGELTKEEIESVGYQYGDYAALTAHYGCEGLENGWHKDKDGEDFYFISDPGLGLWQSADRI